MPTLISADTTRIIVTWATPTDIGGSPITGYRLYMKLASESLYMLAYDGQYAPATKMASISTYNSAALAKTVYNLVLGAYNWVGVSDNSTTLVVSVQSSTSAANSLVSGAGISSIVALEATTITVQAKDDTSTARTTGGDVMFLRVTDVCRKATGSFNCVRVASTDVHYVSTIVASPIVKQLTDNSDGTYTGAYTVNAKGYVTVAVYLMTNGGLYGEYFENIWFDGTPALTKVDSTLNFNWGTGLITSYAADFVSVRWTGKLKAPTSELYMFTVDADDGFRLYLNNKLLIDAWTTGPGTVSAEYTLTQGTFYDLTIEYVEYQGSAKLQLYWSSLSIAKSIIPSDYLWYPKYVAASPYEVTVAQGSTVASLSYATGSALTSAVAGKLQTIFIQSVDINGNAQDSLNDYYSVQLIGPQPDTTTVVISVTATYVSAGKYQAQFVPMVAGTYSLAITLKDTQILNSPFKLVVTPGDIEPTKCVSDLATTATMAAGSTLFMVITTKDIYGNVISTGGRTDITILAKYVDSTAFASPISAPDLTNWAALYGTDISGNYKDESNGKYTGQETIFRAGSFKLNVNIAGLAISGSPVTLTVNPTTIYGSKCVAVGFNTAAVAGVAQSFQVQARDYYSNNVATLIGSVSNAAVTLRSVDYNTVISTGTITDVATKAGAYAVVYTSTLSGVYKLHVTLGGVNITGSPFDVTVSAASTTTATSCTISGLNMALTAGDKLNFLIEARDSYGNIRATSTAEAFAATLTSSASVATPLSSTSQNNGTYLVSTVITTADTYSLSVSFGGVAIKNVPVTGIVVSPSIAQAKKTSLSLSPTPIIVGVATKYKILPKDLYSNVVKSTGLIYSLEFRNENTLATTSVYATYNIDGYDASFTLTNAASYSAIIRMNQYGGLRATYYQTSDFLNPVELLPLNVHSGQTPSKYTRVDATVDFNWGISSPAVSTGFPADFYSVRWSGKIKAPYSEYYKFTVATDNTVRLKINGESLIDTITSGSSLSPSSEYTAYYTMASGTFYDVVLEYVETRGTSLIQLYWQSDSIAKQIIPSTYLYNELYSDTTPFLLVANPAATNPAYCTVTGGYASAVVGVAETITLQAKDQFGNLQLGIFEDFSVKLTSADLATTVVGTVTWTSNGVYTATYTLAVAGTYSMKITVTPFGTTTPLEIAGSPFAVICTTSSTAPAKTLLSGTGITQAVAGVIAVFTITTADANGNVRTSGGDTISVSLTNGAATLTYNSIQVTDNGNGKYTVQYVITDVSAAYTLKVTVNGDVANVLTATVAASPGAPDPTKSSISKATQTQLDIADTFLIYAKDAYSNAIGSGVYLASKIVGSFGTKFFTGALSDAPTGKYSTAFTITSGTSGLCGTYAIYSYFLQQGIKGAYYSNVWLTGDPVLKRLDSSISFNWGSGELITGVASDYVGVEWNGYILPATSESYTFYVTCNDGVRVYVNNVLVIDNYVSVGTGKLIIDQSTPIALTAGQFYPIKVQYFEQTSEASIALEWGTATITRQTIPSTAFYSNVILLVSAFSSSTPQSAPPPIP